MTIGTIWKLEPHTQAKHEILRGYLRAWFPIMSRWQGRVIYLDGFAGPGIYEDGEPGSPIIALETLMTHSGVNLQAGTEFVFLFMEEDEKRCTLLAEQVDRLFDRFGGKPPKVVVEIENKQFEEGVKEILEQLEGEGQEIAPTFAFVDPFGWSGAPMEVMADLLRPRCELLFTFIYDQTSRFISIDNEKVIQQLEDLFGSDDFKQAVDLSGTDRKEKLLELFSFQLRDQIGFEFVNSFEMINSKGRTPYFLVHATYHQKGAEKMKDVLWGVDPTGEFRYSSRLGGQDVLFAEKSEVDPLISAMQEAFTDRTVPIADVESFVIRDTPYRMPHVRQALRALESQDQIHVSGRTRRGTYPEGTTITFLQA
jgi:three-Cys-motif partner protein